MAKNLFFICILMGSLAVAQTTPIPDANFEQQLIALGLDTNGANGNILNVDAEAVTALTITRTDITDFSGLQAFVNLTVLDLGRNDFLTAPLTSLIALEKLVFDDNDILASLDLTQNVNLRHLDIGATGNGGTPSIPSLDLSQNVLLEYLRIYAFTSMDNIDFPHTASLKEIQVIATKATVFDFTHHSGLEELWINQNRETTNILLPADKNTLKFLDIRNQTVSVIDLDGYNALETISLSGTEVSDLTLPTSPTLTNLRVTNHRLPNGYSLSMVPNLVDLEISSNWAPTTFNVDIANNALITRLKLDSNKMTLLDITNNPLISHLNVSSNNLITFDTTFNTELVELEASRNEITNLDLRTSVKLISINLRQNQLPHLDLSENLVLERLNLGINRLPDLDITQNINLSSLYINENLFSGTGLDLTQNGDLTYLNAEHNRIVSLDITQNLDLTSIILNHNLFPGTAILDQFYNIRMANFGIRRGSLEVSHNLLTGQIPDFADIVHLGPGANDQWTRDFVFKMDNNEFHFGDFENQHLNYVGYLTTRRPPPFSSAVFRTYQYAPQAKVNAIENPSRNAGENIILNTTVRGSQNHYTWFKDGTAIPGAPDSPDLVLTDLDTCDGGVYYAEITSDLVPFENSSPPGTNGKNLLLVRNDITLTVNATKNCVSLIQPVNGDSNVPINTGIEWNDNPGACGYKVTVGSASGGNDIADAVDVGDVTVYNFATDLAANSTYYVTITPYFDDGDLLACPEASFTTNATMVAPGCTVLQGLASAGNTNVPLANNIIWNPANGADGYKIVLGTSSGGSEIFSGDVGNVTYYDPVLDLPAATQIYVMITPYNTIADASGCIEESFTTKSVVNIPPIPLCTSLRGPINGAGNVLVSSNLTWNAIADAMGYRLMVGTVSGGTDVFTGDVGNVLMYDLAADLPENSTIFVNIVPYNAHGNAIGCSEDTFTTEALATVPLCTTIASPVNGATDVAVSTNLTWNAIADAMGYRLMVGTVSGGTDVFTGDVGNVLMYDLAVDLPENSTIFVNIIPYNAQGDAVGCSEESFTTEALATVPLCTTMASPANGTTDVAVSTNLTWNAIADATGYRLSVGTTSGGNELLDNEDVGILTSYLLANDLPNNTVVFVNIVPYNSEGDAVGCVEHTFRTIAISIVEDGTKYGFSPDGDGINEFWEIKAIEQYPDNVVTIFNRWGDMVFQMQGYDNRSKVFRGEANRLTKMGAGHLPEGTYFFDIQISGANALKKTKGYVVLKR